MNHFETALDYTEDMERIDNALEQAKIYALLSIAEELKAIREYLLFKDPDYQDYLSYKDEPNPIHRKNKEWQERTE